jgi:hypothetical protein
MTFGDRSFYYLFYGSWQEEKGLPLSYFAVSPWDADFYLFFPTTYFLSVSEMKEVIHVSNKYLLVIKMSV